MSRFDRRRAVVLAVLVGTTLQVGAAGLVHTWRRTATHELEGARVQLQDAQVRAAARAVQAPVRPCPTRACARRWWPSRARTA